LFLKAAQGNPGKGQLHLLFVFTKKNPEPLAKICGQKRRVERRRKTSPLLFLAAKPCGRKWRGLLGLGLSKNYLEA
jgi:hypothetical protein